MNEKFHTASIGKIHLNFFGTPWSRKYTSAEMLIPFIYIPKDQRPI